MWPDFFAEPAQAELTDEERNELETQLCDQERKKAEINMMKVIHDLKNPVSAIEELINHTDDDEKEEIQKKPNKFIRQMTLDLMILIRVMICLKYVNIAKIF